MGRSERRNGVIGGGPTRHRPPLRPLIVLLGGFALAIVAGSPGSAQDETTTTTVAASETTVPAETTTTAAPATSTAPETTAAPTDQTADQLQADRDLVAAAEAAKAAEVDAANAQLGDVTSALEVLQGRVADQSGQLAYINQQLADAEARSLQAQLDLADTEATIAALEGEVVDTAVRSFISEYGGQVMLLTTDDPTEALRMTALRDQATETDLDHVADLQVAREDLALQQSDAAASAAEAQAARAQSEAALATLEQDRSSQAGLASAAEDRLDQLLSEQASLEAIGASVDNGASIDDLASQLGSGGSAGAAGGGEVVIPDLVTDADVADAGKGVVVHVSIVGQVAQLLAAADAAGVDLAGGGYRSSASQIAVRRANCGTSDYAIYEMPASQCSPPTARPGRSMHEKGLAIDFTLNGSLIRSRSGAGWNWLSANAAAYGFSNLPSEPWHWSTNGN